jgi:thiol-disulfide isomerase/thioredoxin
MKRAFLTIIVALAVLGNLSQRSLAAAQDPGACDPKLKSANLNFTLKDASGKLVKLADFKGKLIALNFWATWCIPCRAEIPTLVELQTKYAQQGFQVVGISIDDTLEKMQPFVARYKINYPALTAVNNEAVLDAYGPMVVVPWTVMIKRDGTACAKHIGPITKEALDREIKALL